ncbi:protein singed-like [Daphnia carinata]|uniref:protein singed-like n=1 Tax=Daphnia carinata TaxID=120202 RepID=UPI00257F393C|nr:protein singed-like [Daphnia carinata]XP_057364821.1 protein singed-like [Daphnia carinata]
MTGQNGHSSNGDANISEKPLTTWIVGLVNSRLKYLTAETFGFKVNANGLTLKKKQLWTLEAFGDNTDAVCLRSHLDKYLSVDQFGNVTCDAEEKDNGARFEIFVPESAAGKWALKHPERGYFLGASADKLVCSAKTPTENELWFVHLAARPQVNLRSMGRRRFAHLSDQGDEIHVDANIPWGSTTLFTLEFRDDSRLYAIHTANNRYLSRDGRLLEQCNATCLFSLEYHAGALALRDTQGLYLAPLGSKAVLRTRSTSVTKDELFTLEDSLAQAVFVAMMNSRYVSVKQGVDVTANQDEISDHETFQLEYDVSTGRWYIRTMGDRYWTLETAGGIQASSSKKSSNALFQMDWQEDGSIGFRANNGKFVGTKKSGHLFANADSIDESSKFFFYLINRPMLVLKSEQGFVGYKSGSNCKLECNKANYEAIQVERGPLGLVFFKGQSGRYWQVGSDGITADGDTPEGFYLELREPSKLCIKSGDGAYLMADKNGVFTAGSRDSEMATRWEF